MLATALTLLKSVSIDVGAATREYTFTVPGQYQVIQLTAAADAADSNDKYTPSLVVSGSTIITGSAIVSADTITTLNPDASASPIIPADATCKIVITFAGTAANVKGVSVDLWGIPKR